MNSPRCLSDRALVPTSGAVLKQLPLAMAMLACPCMAMAQADAASARNAQELPTITVTATMSEHDTRTAPASVTVISKEELEIRNPADLLEAVRGEPGITLAPRQVGGRKTISLRGLEGRHVLTLIDGRRISATDDVVGHSDYQYSWLPMSAVERIEVIRGPMSTLYGSEALGGVINLITRKPTDHWEGSVSLNGSALTGGDSGDHGGSAAVYAAGPAGDRLILRVNAETARRPTIAEKEDPRYTELEGSKSNTGGLGAILKLTDQQTLDLSYSKGEERRYYDTDSSGVFYENRYNIDRSLADVTWRGDFDSWKGQLRAYRSEIDITNSRSNGIAPTRPQNMKEEVADGFATTTWGSHKLTAGGELRSEALKNAGLAGGKDDALHKALFLQDEFSLTRQLTLTAGLRYDHHEIFGNEISPRAYLVWEASPDLVIKGGYGHAFKAPTLKQISPNYVGAEGPHTFLGNADIQPEKLDSYELSADWQIGDLGLRATVFRSEVRDLITTRLIRKVGPRGTYLYDNVDKARITGLETGFTWDINSAWSWSTDATLLRTKDRTTGDDLEYRPRSMVGTHIDWRGADGWSARVGAERTGTQHSAEGGLPAYTLWNASVGKKFGKRYSVRAGFENIGDLRLAEKSPLFGYAEQGRTVFVSLRADF